MLAVKSEKQRAKAARVRNARRRKSLVKVGIISVFALAVVGVLIATQALGGESSKVPERVVTGEGRVLGDATAPVTIIEYADFQCPVCKRAESSVVSEIEREYVQQGLVNIEFRMFPFLGQESWDAAQAADAAREQGKFWEYHDALFNAQGRENAGNFSYDKLVEVAREVGLDVPMFEESLTSNKHLEAIQAEVDGARAKGVSSTPTFFVGETMIVGAQDYEKFRDAIEHELAAVDADGAMQ
jgi:protein-disulfide isomerase